MGTEFQYETKNAIFWFKHIHLSLIDKISSCNLLLITFRSASWNQPVLVSYEETWS
jgi:hypothetical protein